MKAQIVSTDRMDDAMEFYKSHRGGCGPVIVTTAIHCKSEEQQTGIFGSIEAAHAWGDDLGDEWTCIHAP